MKLYLYLCGSQRYNFYPKKKENEMKKLIQNILKFILPFLLGGFVLYWVYHDFDFFAVKDTFLYHTNWWWMTASLFFGLLSHVLRGVRWRQTLEPLHATPRRTNCVDAIFLSYASSLILPRMGEMSRCAVLKKSDNISLAQSLGTVVTERLIDTFCILSITALTFLCEIPVFMTLFRETGTKVPSLLHLFSSPWFYVSLFCVIGVVWILCRLLRILSFYEKVKGIALNMIEGMKSLHGVSNKPLFVLYTIGIWGCYILHFYLTFFCFPFSEHLSFGAAMVMFTGGTFAVIVPTPNGAGPWHFAVITMMMLYGVSPTDASVFALIVHAIQTLLVIILGLYGLLHQMYLHTASNK